MKFFKCFLSGFGFSNSHLVIRMYTDWHPLGPVLYRKWKVYDMSWGDKLKLEHFMTCGAPYGGPVALVADSKKPNYQSLPVELKSKIFIKSSSGIQIADIDWDGKNVSGMGWTDGENLIVVTDTGCVRLYDLSGKAIAQYYLINSTSTSTIMECHFWGNGVAVIANNMMVYVAEGLSTHDLLSKGPRIFALQTNLGPDRSFTSMAIVPPLLSQSGLLEVIIGASNGSVVVVHEGEGDNSIIEDQIIQDKIGAAITKIAVGPSGKHLACYRKDGILTVMSASFTKKVVDFDTNSLTRPIEIVWCGEDAVVMQWRNTGIVMVGPFGDWLNFPYDVALHLVPERDCCRIITSEGCEILQRVPDTTVSIRSVGSTDPAALMYDAMEAFEEGDPKSDENIRSIAAANQLGDAVHACIDAAASEFDVLKQQSMLKAASYGKAFCPDADPSEFVETARKLRVLNEVRKPEIGLPLTIQQYNVLTPEVLVGRLTTRKHHFLALKICELLKIRNDRVLVHWAREKVKRMWSTQASQASVDKKIYEDIKETIKRQLEPYGRISYLSVAEAAYEISNNSRLATLILSNEQHSGEQIPLLLRMGEEELALQKAINSEDTDLIYFTLISLESRIQSSHVNLKDVENLYKTIHNHLEAANLMKIYYRNKVSATDRSILHGLLMYGKNFYEAGVAATNQALLQTTMDVKVHLLKDAAQLFNQGRDTGFFKTMVDEQIELLEFQKNLKLRSPTGKDFTDLTVSATLYELTKLGIDPNESRWTEQEIAKLVKKFKVPEKLLWYTKINCYSSNNAWEPLYRLSIEKKSPVGYKPFATACIRQGRPVSEVEKYIEKITSLEDRCDMYIEVKAFRKAVEPATKLRDPNRLQEIARLCQDPELERHINGVLQSLK